MPAIDPTASINRKAYRNRRIHDWEDLLASLGLRPGAGAGSGSGSGSGTGGMPFPPAPANADDHLRYVAQGQGWRPSGEVYIHNQPANAMSWSIQHCLGKIFPNIVLMDEAGAVVWGTPNWDTATPNYVEILFSIPSRGTAFLS